MPLRISIAVDGVIRAAAAAALAAVLLACEDGPVNPGGSVVDTVVVNPPEFQLAVGEMIRLDALAFNARPLPIPGGARMWVSSEPQVADVDSAGVVRGRKEGVARITVSIDGIEASALATVVPVRASEWREHTCLVGAAGGVWCWGRGGNGELGHGARSGATAPVRALLDAPAALANGGGGHSCALTSQGAAFCWGRGTEGQLGEGATVTRSRPVPVRGPLTWRSISAGGQHTCGITGEGGLRCWGAAAHGQLGNGARVAVSTPIVPTGSLLPARVSAGARHSCALVLDGSAFCWGDNREGQLGDGTTETRSVPTRVLTLERFAEISAGARHTCAITGDGRAFCWGDNREAQLGLGSLTSSVVPRRVAAFPDIAFDRISAGAVHTCGVSRFATAHCWGAGQFGQIGDGARVLVGNPVRVEGEGWTDIVAGTGHSCGVRGGQGYCWGLNVFGQAGSGDLVDRARPTPVVGGVGFTRSLP